MTGRIRSVKPEWLEDEPLVACSSDARVLSVGLLLLADDHGNGRAGAIYLSSRVFPSRDSLEVLARALEELEKIRYAELYIVDGQRYFHVRNWKKHQRVDHPGKPIVPTPREQLPETLASPTESLAPDRDRDRDQRPGPPVAVADSRDTPEPAPDPAPDPGTEIRCPVPFLLDDQDFAALEVHVALPRRVAEAWLASWAADQRAAGELRHAGTWVRWGLKALRGEWSDTNKKAEMRAAAEPNTESPEPPKERVRTYADVLAARRSAGGV